MKKRLLSIGLLGLSLLPGPVAGAQLPAAPEAAGLSLAAKAPTGLAFVPPEVLREVPSAELPYSGFAPPRQVDLAEHMPAPGFQGRQNSCVAWVSAYAVKTYQEKLEQRYTLTQAGQPDLRRIFSPAFVYNQINQGRDGGATLIDALNLLSGRGALPWAEMPYDIDNFTRQPSSDQLKVARRYRIATWRQVNVKDGAELKAHLLAGYPIMVGAMVDESLYRLRPGAVWTRAGGKSLGGHAMVVVGYDDQLEAFKVMNSWGKGWGQRGFGWIGYRQFKKAVREGYVAKDAVNERAPELVRRDAPGAHSTHRPLSTRPPERSMAGDELSRTPSGQGPEGGAGGRDISDQSDAAGQPRFSPPVPMQPADADQKLHDPNPDEEKPDEHNVARPEAAQSNRNDGDKPEIYYQQEEEIALPLSLRRHERFAGDLVLSGQARLEGLDGRQARVVVRLYRDAAGTQSLRLPEAGPAQTLPDGTTVAVSPELLIGSDALDWRARIPLEALPKELTTLWARPVLYLDGFGVETGELVEIELGS